MVMKQIIFYWDRILRVKIKIEYDGTNYVGWQKQKNGRSIQEEIEKCLKQLFKEEIELYVAGRTDSGVHAIEQVAHFDINHIIDPKKIYLALNSQLHKSKNKISILTSEEMPSSFHSRFSAKKRTYLYKILNRKTFSPLDCDRFYHVPYFLDENLMTNSSRYLIGNHDFNSFRSKDCQAKSSLRSIENIVIKRKNEKIQIEISAKSFLHNQVRIIVGTLLNIGRKFWNEQKLLEILKSRNRDIAGPTAPPVGLYLKKIDY